MIAKKNSKVLHEEAKFVRSISSIEMEIFCNIHSIFILHIIENDSISAKFQRIELIALTLFFKQDGCLI